MLLLNGSFGVGTGWSTSCYSYNPIEVLENVLANAEGRTMTHMAPWAAGFRGEIQLRTGAGRGQPWLPPAESVPDGAAAPLLPTKFLSRGVAELGADGVIVSELHALDRPPLIDPP